jgi:hypothetical protein
MLTELGTALECCTKPRWYSLSIVAGKIGRNIPNITQHFKPKNVVNMAIKI